MNKMLHRLFVVLLAIGSCFCVDATGAYSAHEEEPHVQELEDGSKVLVLMCDFPTDTGGAFFLDRDGNRSHVSIARVALQETPPRNGPVATLLSYCSELQKAMFMAGDRTADGFLEDAWREDLLGFCLFRDLLRALAAKDGTRTAYGRAVQTDLDMFAEGLQPLAILWGFCVPAGEAPESTLVNLLPNVRDYIAGGDQTDPVFWQELYLMGAMRLMAMERGESDESFLARLVFDTIDRSLPYMPNRFLNPEALASDDRDEYISDFCMFGRKFCASFRACVNAPILGAGVVVEEALAYVFKTLNTEVFTALIPFFNVVNEVYPNKITAQLMRALVLFMPELPPDMAFFNAVLAPLGEGFLRQPLSGLPPALSIIFDELAPLIAGAEDPTLEMLMLGAAVRAVDREILLNRFRRRGAVEIEDLPEELRGGYSDAGALTLAWFCLSGCSGAELIESLSGTFSRCSYPGVRFRENDRLQRFFSTVGVKTEEDMDVFLLSAGEGILDFLQRAKWGRGF
ncbi:MAG: hypothetical protein LBI30_00500 [Holosporales bacterium]|jgi:hypothetical protein|nr:hypothetical protein [Holosporales bacterium]